MTFKIGNTVVATIRGVPYMWGTGDTTTTTSSPFKISNPDPATYDDFGRAVGIDNNRIIIGDPQDSEVQTNSGAVYVYDFSGNLITKIKAPTPNLSDYFGSCVGVDKGRIIVGCYSDDTGFPGAGAAYLYDSNGTYVNKLTASDAARGDYFGYSIAIGDGKIVVGAILDDDNGSDSGSAYIYNLSGTQLKKIKAPDGAAGDWFGSVSAIGNGRIAINAGLDIDNGISSGSVYLYNIDGGYIKKIVPSDAANSMTFGSSIAIGSGLMVIGAENAVTSTGGTGAVYLYDIDGNFIKRIDPIDGWPSVRYFGASVGIGSGRIVVSAPLGANSGSFVYDLDGNYLERVYGADTIGVSSTPGTAPYGTSVKFGKIVIGNPEWSSNSSYGPGATYVWSTPIIYNIYDAAEMLSNG